MNLDEMLNAFKTSLSEEQIWAICYQYTRKFIEDRTPGCYPVATNLASVIVTENGNVTVVGDKYERSDKVLIDAFGRVLFDAFDYGVEPDCDKPISPELERLIERMTLSYDGLLTEEDDEGYEEENHTLDSGPCTWEIVLKICERHLIQPSEATDHYSSVCQNLVREAVELKSFLDLAERATETLKVMGNNVPDGHRPDDHKPALHLSEWTNLWVKVVNDLRIGVELKKVERIEEVKHFELTPYESLMEDIRQKNFDLKQVPESYALKSKSRRDTHSIILEYIRSRPALKPTKNRYLQPAPPRSKSLHDLLLEQIQQPPHLRHVQPPDESPLLKRISYSNRNNTISASRSCDDILCAQSGKRRLNAPPYAAEVGVAISSTDFDESDTDSEGSISDDIDGEESLLSPLDQNYSVSCSSEASSSSSVHQEKVRQTADATGPLQRRTTTVRQKKVLPAITVSSTKASFESMQYSKLSSRGGGIKRAHTFSTPSKNDFYQSYSTRPSRREVRTKATLKALEAFEEEDQGVSLPPPLSNHLSNVHKQDFSNLQSSSENISVLKQMRHSESTEKYVTITTDELIAIRKKLVAHDLEQYQDRGQLYSSLKKGKTCFNCRVREFNIFWWARTCQICEQKICSNCMRKVEAPSGEKLEAPICDLRPSFQANHFSGNSALEWDISHTVSSQSSVSRARSMKRLPRPDFPFAKVRKLDVCAGCQNLMVKVVSVSLNRHTITDRLKRSASSVGAVPTRTIPRSNTTMNTPKQREPGTPGKYRSIVSQ